MGWIHTSDGPRLIVFTFTSTFAVAFAVVFSMAFRLCVLDVGEDRTLRGVGA